MKTAIVTGSTGFIGSAFVEYLLNHKVKVIALGRKDLHMVEKTRRTKLDGSNYIKLEMREISKLKNVLIANGLDIGSCCTFFNLAWGGVTSLSDLNIAAQMRNASWAVSALEIAKEIGCIRFIQVGTMEEAFTEKYLELDHHTSDKYNRHVIYSVAKITAKNAIKIKAKQLDIDFIYVLHSHVMGPNDDKDSFLQVTLQRLISGHELVFSTGEQFFDVVSLHDCSLGYYLICQKGVSGQEYWVGSGEPRRLREYVEIMYNLFPSGQKLEFGKLAYNDIVLGKEVFSIINLVEDTGYQPTMNYEQTVEMLYQHLKHR